MKILFDHLCFWEKYGGVSRYFVEILKRMPQESYLLSVKYSNNEYLNQLNKLSTHKFFPELSFRGKPRIEKTIGKMFSISDMLFTSFDIYHQTHYDPYAYKWLNHSVIKVSTIHDMNFLAVPDCYSKNNILLRHQKISAEKSDHIITISKNTKKDLMKYWQIPEKKITVIPHGITSLPINMDCPIFDFEYILFVGTRNNHKNFNRFIEAFKIVKEYNSNIFLVCVGKPFSFSEKCLLQYLDIINNIVCIQATDYELSNLYRNAQLFVFPSLYEGFGIPILEALSCNCPIAISNTSCFPEIAGNAAAYFDPYNIPQISDVILNVLNDSSLRSKLLDNSHLVLNNYSWDESYFQHMSLYQNLVQ